VGSIAASTSLLPRPSSIPGNDSPTEEFTSFEIGFARSFFLSASFSQNLFLSISFYKFPLLEGIHGKDSLRPFCRPTSEVRPNIRGTVGHRLSASAAHPQAFVRVSPS
jgi:hypothetical protein